MYWLHMYILYMILFVVFSPPYIRKLLIQFLWVTVKIVKTVSLKEALNLRTGQSVHWKRDYGVMTI